MPALLRVRDFELKDLAHSTPVLYEATTGHDTGLTLIRCVGAGGNSTVFLAECDPLRRTEDLSPGTPRRLAVKIMQPRSARSLLKGGIDPASVFVRESVALGRMMERRPPTAFVVGFFGSGTVDVEVGGEVHALPWLAIEFVDGGKAGPVLTGRIRKEGGADPLRAQRLVRGLIEGTRALHEQGILHRDLKPDNVLIAGPIDDETVKLADCGIARIEGLQGTVQGMTVTYGGPEQTLSRPGESCPVIDTWTDVHALAATVWFLFAGEDWCRGPRDLEWFRGQRRSLGTAKRLHPALRDDPEALARLDAVLARGAAQRLPERAWAQGDANTYRDAAMALLPGMFRGEERYPDVNSFAAELFPVISYLADRWTATASEEDLAATAFRVSMPVDSERAREAELAEASPFAAMEGGEIDRAHWLDPILAGATSDFAFRPDGRILARFADRLFYLGFVDDVPHAVGVPSKRIALVGASRWMVASPAGGFALVGPNHILLLQSGSFQAMGLPEHPSGAEVGPICTVAEPHGSFAVVTAPTAPERPFLIWPSHDARSFGTPIELPFEGEIAAIAYGPFGYFAVGRAQTPHARASLVGFDGRATVYAQGVHERPPLTAVVSGGSGSTWAAGEGFVLCFDKERVTSEANDVDERPVSMKLDLVGVPWMLTTHSVMRRHLEDGRAVWRVYHRRESNEPSFVSFGFGPGGVCAFDIYGSGVLIKPFDIEDWSQVETWIRNPAED